MLKQPIRYFVLLIDREKARMFTVYLDVIEDRKDFFNDSVPQRVRANEEHYYGRSDKIFRHIEDHLNRHLKLVVDKVQEFIKNKKIRFIIIGGHKEMLPKIKSHLPRKLQKLVHGEFVTELNIPLDDIFRESSKIAQKIFKNSTSLTQ